MFVEYVNELKINNIGVEDIENKSHRHCTDVVTFKIDKSKLADFFTHTDVV